MACRLLLLCTLLCCSVALHVNKREDPPASSGVQGLPFAADPKAAQAEQPAEAASGGGVDLAKAVAKAADELAKAKAALEAEQAAAAAATPAPEDLTSRASDVFKKQEELNNVEFPKIGDQAGQAATGSEWDKMAQLANADAPPELEATVSPDVMAAFDAMATTEAPELSLVTPAPDLTMADIEASKKNGGDSQLDDFGRPKPTGVEKDMLEMYRESKGKLDPRYQENEPNWGIPDRIEATRKVFEEKLPRAQEIYDKAQTDPAYKKKMENTAQKILTEEVLSSPFVLAADEFFDRLLGAFR